MSVMDIRERIEGLHSLRRELARDMMLLHKLEERARERQRFLAATEEEFEVARTAGQYGEECAERMDDSIRSCYRALKSVKELIAELERLLPTEPMRG